MSSSVAIDCNIGLTGTGQTDGNVDRHEGIYH